jgi:tRNA-specific 2-thiouridylase
MSGGVDSSVAAALLVQQGYEVIGMMLRLWSEPGQEDTNRCCTPDAVALARRVAARLGIPFYAVDAQEAFRRQVVPALIDGYLQGITPNPCLVCNRRIRWGLLLDQALALEADFMATGHYARLRADDQGVVQLLRGLDHAKDQSYVLHVLDQARLRRTLLPIGEYTKPQVRDLARQFGLPVANRADSQDLCFLAGGDYRDFLRRHAPEAGTPGPIVTRDGRQLGVHAGLAFYTIGQRKGLGVSSPQPLYVLAKDRSQNTLVVGTADELGGRELTASAINWIADAPPTVALRAEIKIRYTAAAAWGLVTQLPDGRAHVVFDAPQRDITPGQAAVFYAGEVCMGGGIIE